MSTQAVCRICLAVNVHMHVVQNSFLLDLYTKLCNNNSSQIKEGNNMLACYICYSQLIKCLRFMQKVQKADALLAKVLNSNEKNMSHISLLSHIDRQAHQLTVDFSTSAVVYTVVAEPVFLNDIVLKSEVSIDLVKSDVKLKEELKEKSEIPDPQSDVDNHDDQTDSEDDVPLKSISVKKKLQNGVKLRDRVKVRKKEGITEKMSRVKAFKIDARRIQLTQEQQMQELLQRAQSMNYLNSPYKCELCFKGFVDTRAYENHQEKHDERSGRFECGVCRMRYSSARQLRSHNNTAHATHYKCNACQHVSHTANQAREHENWHNGFTFECQLCSQKFRKSTSYLTHMRIRHPTEHVCNVCGKSFVGRHGLLMHKTKSHKREEFSENPDEPASERYCEDCNIQFVSLEAWKMHFITSSVKHSNDSSPQCRICSLSLTSDEALTTHMREHEKTFRKSRIQRPMKVNPGKMVQLACDQCGANFINRSKLQAHVKRVHLGLKYNKNIVCEVCGKKCTSNASLKYHQRTHTGERPHACATCSKRFADTNQLRIHARTHSGERPYCCAACGKRFSQKPALNRHYRVHTGAKPYECQYCSKTFSQSNSLKLHVRTVHLKLPPNNRRNKAQNAVHVNGTVAEKVQGDVSIQTLG